MDDDLFEDNDIIIVDEEVSTSEEALYNGREDFAGLSEHERGWLKELKQVLSDTDSFSFAIYTQTAIGLFNIMTQSDSGLKNCHSSHRIATNAFLADATYSFETWLALKEQERYILIGGQYLRILENVLSTLANSPASKEPNSFCEYMYLAVGYQHKTTMLYLTDLIETYQSFCKDNNIEVDELLVAEQAKSYLSIQDRLSYGLGIHSPVVEGVGEVENWQTLRESLQSGVSDAVVKIVGFLDDLINKIRAGDPSAREGLVHDHD